MIYIVLIITVITLNLLLFMEEKYKHMYKKAKTKNNIKIWMEPEEEFHTELLKDVKNNCPRKGELLNNLYRIEGLLGEGGMGRVYLCRNIKLGNLWAVKHLCKGGVGKTTFIVEDKILKKLNHTHLPQVIDIFEDKEGTYIVESYIEGTSLDKKLMKEGPFNEEQVIKWCRQLTDVLVYLHGMEPHPIIYRDMKPSNVIITPDDQAVLIDFGVSIEDMGEGIKMTGESTMAITAKFAAPEQFEGYADARSDIYSLGMMMYYLLTGSFPIVGRPLKKQNNKISKELLKILDNCIHKEMHERYQTMEELRKQLEGWQTNSKAIFGSFRGKPTYHSPLDYKKIILTMSPESTGKTTVAVNMAWTLAQNRVKTILVDTDFMNKDIYNYFNRDFSNCLGNQTGIPEPEKINRYLSIFTEHRDVNISLNLDKIMEIILQSKVEAQVVVIDVGRDLPPEVINDLLSLADHKIIVVDQRISLLNRLPHHLYSYQGKLKEVDLVINRYIETGYINTRNIQGFFNKVKLGEDILFDVKINRIFKLNEDYPSILKGLEERLPAVAVDGSKIKKDMEILIDHCYRVN